MAAVLHGQEDLRSDILRDRSRRKKHKMLTGAPNQAILNNLMKLAHSNVEFILRLPMIPHVNDSCKDLKEMIAFIKKLEGIGTPIPVDLLTYHLFAEPKYEKFGKKYALKGLVPLSSNQIKRIVRLFEKQGISLKLIPSYASVLYALGFYQGSYMPKDSQ